MDKLTQHLINRIDEVQSLDRISMLNDLNLNTFDALVLELEFRGFSGIVYNGIYYSEYEMYSSYWHHYPDGSPWL